MSLHCGDILALVLLPEATFHQPCYLMHTAAKSQLQALHDRWGATDMSRNV